MHTYMHKYTHIYTRTYIYNCMWYESDTGFFLIYIVYILVHINSSVYACVCMCVCTYGHINMQIHTNSHRIRIRIRSRIRIRNSLKSRIRIRDRIRKKSFRIHNTGSKSTIHLILLVLHIWIRIILGGWIRIRSKKATCLSGSASVYPDLKHWQKDYWLIAWLEHVFPFQIMVVEIGRVVWGAGPGSCSQWIRNTQVGLGFSYVVNSKNIYFQF